MMFRKIIITSVLAGAVLGLGSQGIARAQLTDLCAKQPDAVACRENAATSTRGSGLYGPDGLLTRIARLLAIVAGVSGVFLIMMAGFKYVTSSGDPSNINEAKNTILYAAVGLAIAVVAQSLIIFVLDRLPG